MSFIRLEDAEFRALFSLIPSRACFVYYINRVSSIFLNISNITINSIFLHESSCDLCCRLGDTVSTHDAVYFPSLLMHKRFYSVLCRSKSLSRNTDILTGKMMHLNQMLCCQLSLQRLFNLGPVKCAKIACKICISGVNVAIKHIYL